MLFEIFNSHNSTKFESKSPGISIQGLSRIAKNYRRIFFGYVEKIKVVKSNAF
jgi:hypothetical protein